MAATTTKRSIEIILMRSAWIAEMAIFQPATTAAAIIRASAMSDSGGLNQDSTISSADTPTTPHVFHVFIGLKFFPSLVFCCHLYRYGGCSRGSLIQINVRDTAFRWYAHRKYKKPVPDDGQEQAVQ